MTTAELCLCVRGHVFRALVRLLGTRLCFGVAAAWLTVCACPHGAVPGPGLQAVHARQGLKCIVCHQAYGAPVQCAAGVREDEGRKEGAGPIPFTVQPTTPTPHHTTYMRLSCTLWRA